MFCKCADSSLTWTSESLCTEESTVICFSVAVKLSEIVEEIKQAAEYIFNMAAKLGVRYCWQPTPVTLGRVLFQAYP